jgi:hypothetical protein
MVGRFCPIGVGEAARLPRSLHYVTRRTKDVRRRKPGHFGRDDRREAPAVGWPVWSHRFGCGCKIAKVPPLRGPAH